MIALLPVILLLVEAGIKVAPEIIAAGRTEIDLYNSGSAPTVAQTREIMAALDLANSALQAAGPSA
jgi:hypothetical protein